MDSFLHITLLLSKWGPNISDVDSGSHIVY